MTTFNDTILFYVNGVAQNSHSGDTISISRNLTIASPSTFSVGVNISFSSGFSSPAINQTAPAAASSGAAATNMSLSSQTGGAANGTSTTGGVGGNLTISSGVGGAGTGTNTSGGAGGNLLLTSGAGGAKTGSGTTGTAGNVQLQIGGTSNITWSSANEQWQDVGAITINQVQKAGTGANNGTSTTIQAQQGQQQTGATANNNGGNLILSSGTAGTGGSGAAGVAGNLNLQTGGSTQVSVSTTTTTISNGLTQSGGAVSLTGNAASQFTTSSGALTLSGAAGIAFQNNGTTNLTLTSALFQWATGITSPTINQAAASSAVGTNLLVSAQAGNGSGNGGGFLVLQGGATGGGAGLRGGVRLQTNGSTSETLAEVTEPVSGQRVVALCQVGSGVTSTQMPTSSGDGVIYIGNAQTNPTANPVSGAILYSTGGVLNIRQSNGTTFAIASGGSSVTWANDLVNSTNTNQYVSGLSFNGTAGGGTISINGTATVLQWANNATPVINQAAPASSSGTGTAAVVSTLTAQTGGATTGSATTAGVGGNYSVNAGTGGSGAGGTNASGGAGGNVNINSGTGGAKSGTGTTGANGTINLQVAGTTFLSIGPAGMAGQTRTEATNYTIDSSGPDMIIFVDTSAARTITLPAPTAGRIIILKDKTGTAETNNITLAQHASEKIEGVAASRTLSTNFGSWRITSDGTDWWLI